LFAMGQTAQALVAPVVRLVPYRGFSCTSLCRSIVGRGEGLADIGFPGTVRVRLEPPGAAPPLLLAIVIGVLVLSSFFGLPLWMGVVGHEGSTLLVVLNGLRLLWESPPTESLAGPAGVRTAREP
jgi:hypothetical protein